MGCVMRGEPNYETLVRSLALFFVLRGILGGEECARGSGGVRNGRLMDVSVIPHHDPRDRRVRPAGADEAHGGGVFAGRGAALESPSPRRLPSGYNGSRAAGCQRTKIGRCCVSIFSAFVVVLFLCGCNVHIPTVRLVRLKIFFVLEESCVFKGQCIYFLLN